MIKLSKGAQNENADNIWRPWQPGLFSRLQHWLTTPQFHAALQYCGGQLLVCVVVFVNVLSYEQACLASLFHTAVAVLLSGDHSVGARILAAAAFVGTAWTGLLMCGIAVSLARLAHGQGYTVLLSVFAVMGVALGVLLRASPNKDVAGSGLFIIVFFGVGIITGQFVWPAGLFWKKVIVELFADALMAVVSSVVAGCLVLPVLASNKLRHTLADTINKLAASISGYAGVIAEHDSATAAELEVQSAHPGEHSEPWHASLSPDPFLDRERIRRAVDPAIERAKLSVRPPYVPRAAALRPLLLQARASAVRAAFEPPFFRRCRLANWHAVLDALEGLLSRVACLESAVEGATGEGRLARLATLQRQTGVNVLESLTVVFARIAASCASLAAATRDCTDVTQAGLEVFSESWGATEAALAKGLHDSSVKVIMSLAWDPRAGAVAYRHMPEVRGLYYVCTLTGGIMEDMAHMERAVKAALGRRPAKPHHRQSARPLKGRAVSDWSAIVATLQPPLLSSSHAAATSVNAAGWDDTYVPASRRAESSTGDISSSRRLSRRSLATRAPQAASIDCSNPSPLSDVIVAPCGHSSDLPPGGPAHESHASFQAGYYSSSSTECSVNMYGSSLQLPSLYKGSTRRASFPAAIGSFGSRDCWPIDTMRGAGSGRHSQEVFRSQRLLPVKETAPYLDLQQLQNIDINQGTSDGCSKHASIPIQPQPVAERVNTLQDHGTLHIQGVKGRAASAIRPAISGGSAMNAPITPGSPGGSSLCSNDSGMVSESADEMESISRQSSLIKSTDSLEGMSLRPLQNMPMDVFISRSRSHGFALNEAGHPVTSQPHSRCSSATASGSGDASDQGEISNPVAVAVKTAQAAILQWRFRRKGKDDAGGHKTSSTPGVPAAVRRPGCIGHSLRRYGAYIRPIALGMLGVLALRAWYHMAMDTLPHVCRNPSYLIHKVRTDRNLQFGIKFLCGVGSALVLIIVLCDKAPALRDWKLLYAYFTFVVVLNEKVETTSSKGLLRISTTALGGALAVVVMLRSSVATSPYALTAIILTSNFFIGLFMLTQFKYAVFLAISSLNGLILCQYVPCTNPETCANTGQLRPFYAQTAAVAVAIVALLATNLVAPWYSSDSATELLGTIFEEATQMVQHHFDVARWEMARPAGEGAAAAAAEGGAQPLDPNWLQARIVRPLTVVQAIVQDETVVWRSGILVLPKYIHHLLDAALLLVDRLTAAQMVLSAKPIVSGRYSASAWQQLMLPMENCYRAAFETVGRLGTAVAAFLKHSWGPASEDTIRQLMAALEEHRLEIRIVQQTVMRCYYTSVRAPGLSMTKPPEEPNASTSGTNKPADVPSHYTSTQNPASSQPRNSAAMSSNITSELTQRSQLAVNATSADHANSADTSAADTVSVQCGGGHGQEGRLRYNGSDESDESGHAGDTARLRSQREVGHLAGLNSSDTARNSSGSTDPFTGSEDPAMLMEQTGAPSAAAPAHEGEHTDEKLINGEAHEQETGQEAASWNSSLTGRTPDDICRFSSYSFAVTEQLDKVMLFANIVLEHAAEIRARRHWLHWKATSA